MNCTPVMAPAGMIRVPRPFLVHQATSSPSVSPMVESGLGGAQRHQSSRWLTKAVWQRELGPSVVELQRL